MINGKVGFHEDAHECMQKACKKADVDEDAKTR